MGEREAGGERERERMTTSCCQFKHDKVTEKVRRKKGAGRKESVCDRRRRIKAKTQSIRDKKSW